jgi:16S rRNA (cytidine1402-2'-O)-methyltransferase
MVQIGRDEPRHGRRGPAAAVDGSGVAVEEQSGWGTLYLVATPIGNPGDITARAVEVLGKVGLIAAEDTRNARTLLAPLGITTRTISYHDHNEESRVPHLLDVLRSGTDVALICDAGTPMVNDPGYRITVAAIEHGIRVSPLPGPSAALSALVGSGLPVHSFSYGGFLPRKSAARQTAIKQWRDVDTSLIFFEAPHRLIEMLQDLLEVLGDRQAALARSLTKRHEEFIRGKVSELIAVLKETETVRGEFTVVVGGAGPAAGTEAEALAERLTAVLLANGAAPRLIRDAVRDLTGLPRNWVYDHVQAAADAHKAAPGDVHRPDPLDPSHG